MEPEGSLSCSLELYIVFTLTAKVSK